MSHCSVCLSCVYQMTHASCPMHVDTTHGYCCFRFKVTFHGRSDFRFSKRTEWHWSIVAIAMNQQTEWHWPMPTTMSIKMQIPEEFATDGAPECDH